jgi:hypothetical protein
LKRIISITLVSGAALVAFAFTVVNHRQKKLTADEVISNYVTAMGGADKLASIKNIYMEGIINANGRKIPTRKWVVSNKCMRTETSISGITNFTIVRRDSGWSYAPTRGRKSAEPLTANMVAASQPGLDLEGTLVNYKAKGYKVNYEGTDEIEGSEAYKLEEIINDSLVETFYFDPDSYYIMRVRLKSSMGGRVITSASDYSVYQKTADGYIFPMQIGNVRYQAIKVNSDINEKLFKPSK